MRDAAMEPRPAPGGPDGESGPVGRSWRVSSGLVVVKIIVAVLLAGVAALSIGRDPLGVWVVGAAALAVAIFALRDLVAPVRLAADPEGVTVVVGFARRLRLPWSAVERIRVDERSRYGVRSEHLEIDLGESVHLFSRNELGAPVAEVADELSRLNPDKP